MHLGNYMNFVYFGNTLNRHQVYLADALYKLTGGDYIYVETVPPNYDNTFGGKAKVNRPYTLCAYESEVKKDKAIQLARNADVALFGAESFDYEIERMKTTGKIAFEVSERVLKRGWLNLLSPRLLKKLWYYHTKRWKCKPLYKLCASAYGARDQYLLHTFRGKCFKWGYFTNIDNLNIKELIQNRHNNVSPCSKKPKTIRILWCSRFLSWKHPELVIYLAQWLKNKNYPISIDLYGDGPEKARIMSLSEKLSVTDIVHFCGNVDNDSIILAMRQSDIFLFTSDRREGWGATLNEAMSNGCTVVASCAAGSVPYLVRNKINGLIFKSENLSSLCENVEFLLDNPDKREEMAIEAYRTINDHWSPKIAASSLIRLSLALENNEGGSFISSGPCSKDLPKVISVK